MANRTVPQGGATGSFEKLWVDLGSGIYAEAVVDYSVRSFEDQVNQRGLFDLKPIDTDSIPETLQNAAVAIGSGTPINVKGFKSITAQVVATSGTWTGAWKASIDGGATYFLIAYQKPDDRSFVNGTTTQFNPAATTVSQCCLFPDLENAAYDFLKFEILTWTSGSITVKSRKHPR
jgi:hypothetical protein